MQMANENIEQFVYLWAINKNLFCVCMKMRRQTESNMLKTPRTLQSLVLIRPSIPLLSFHLLYLLLFLLLFSWFKVSSNVFFCYFYYRRGFIFIGKFIHVLFVAVYTNQIQLRRRHIYANIFLFKTKQTQTAK